MTLRPSQFCRLVSSHSHVSLWPLSPFHIDGHPGFLLPLIYHSDPDHSRTYRWPSFVFSVPLRFDGGWERKGQMTRRPLRVNDLNWPSVLCTLDPSPSLHVRYPRRRTLCLVLCLPISYLYPTFASYWSCSLVRFDFFTCSLPQTYYVHPQFLRTVPESVPMSTESTHKSWFRSSSH